MNRAPLPHYAGAIVRSPGGRFLCQLRDQKKGIQFPGYWTCTPGGHVRRGERPRRAIARELYEEFEIKVKRLRFYRIVVERSRRTAGVYDFFTADAATEVSKLRCHEGRKAAFYFASAILRLRLHPISRRIFRTYLSGLRRVKKASRG